MLVESEVEWTMRYSVSFVFNEKKAAQAAACLIELNSGRMNYMKLIKLLYLADRRFILEWGNSITTDSYVSMDNGPVISRIYDLIKNGRVDNGSFWSSCFRTDDYEIVLQKHPGNDYLSPMEMEVLADVNTRFSGCSEWDLVDYCHKHLPEWQDPHGSSIQITIEDIIGAEKAGSPDYDDAVSAVRLAAEVQKSNYFLMKERSL